jgi:autotransporter translocation and assembly factor TamB
LGIVLLGLVVLGLVVRLSLKTSPVQNWVRGFIVDTANQQLNAELAIDKLSGDLWNELKISGISLTQSRDDTVAQIDSIHTTHNIWALFEGTIEISKFDIHRPKLNVRQQDSSWNVATLVPASDDTSATESSTLAFDLQDLKLHRGQVSVQGDSLPVESRFEMRDIEISSRFSYSSQGFDFDLRQLGFRIEQTQLNEPLTVQTAATGQQNRITLEKLVIGTGNSMLKSTGFASAADSAVELNIQTQPLSWRDITSYARDFPLRQDVQIDVGLSGQPEQFTFSLKAGANGLDDLAITSRFQWKSGIVLQEVTAQATRIDAATLLADTTMPSLQQLDARFTGVVELANYEDGKGELSISAEQIRRSPYQLDRFSANGNIDGSNASLEFNVNRRQQQISTNIEMQQLWNKAPRLRATVAGTNIDPAYWTQDTTLAGDLNFKTEISGQGWYPQKLPWRYSFAMDNSRLMGQPISEFSANGEVSQSDARLDARLQIRESVVELAAQLRNMTKEMAYSYDLQARDVNLGPFLGHTDFSTALHGRISGEGRGVNPQNMRLQTSVAVDSSIVNGELIRNFSAVISIRDSIAVVDTASLSSTLADASFNLRMNMLRPYDASNELAVQSTLKDIEALAPLAGVSELRAQGTVNGSLTPYGNENLRFLGTLDLSGMQYDDLFAADNAKGSVDIRTTNTLEYLADLDLNRPNFSGAQLQNLTLITQGSYIDSTANGEFEFRFSSPNEGRIEQSGTYTLMPDSVGIQTTNFNIISDYRTLTLEDTFELVYHNDRLRIDTMRVSSGDGAFLEMGIPTATANEQRGFVRGRDLNTAVIQSSLLGNTFFEGMLSGNFEIARQDTALNAGGRLLLTEVTYEETSFDTLQVDGTIADNRLKGSLALNHENQKLVTGWTNLPFKLGDPEALPPAFFRESVNGEIRVRDIAIDRFQSFFTEMGLTQTSGIFGLRGTLEGSAGEPEFTADASLKKAQLSGVSVDSVTAGINYRHEDAELQLDASVMSLRQKAAQINAEFPLFIDMKTFRVDLPQAEDSLAVDVETNNFNLKALNDFVDRLTLREMTGRLDGMVKVRGQMQDLKTDGELQLSNGAFRLVPAGIRVDDIQTTMVFDPNKLRLTNFTANSGGGSLTASGMLELEKMVPGDMDFEVEAKSFRAANTSQYNAVIDLDARAQGSITNPKIKGSLSFIRGFLQLQNFGEKSVETVQLDSVENNGPEVSIYDSLALNMNVNFNRRFFIRNERYLEMEIELDGQVDLLKDPGKDLEMFGTMTTPRGYARPFGKEFNLQEGSITFSGPPGNPQLNIRTRYEPPQPQEDIVIWYVIEGTVEKPQFRYESQPPMELENIIAYTLFGQPFYALDSWKQVVASSGGNTTAADVALDVLLDRVEALATQKLGIDVVKIDNTRVGGETGTSITTGWYLNPKIFFAIQNVITGSTPDTGFLLEYMLRKDLKLILQQGNGIQQGVDLKWNYDY